jgi:ATP-dependent Lon protease
MYLHAKNNQFRQYLKHKANCTEPDTEEIDFSQLPEVVEIFNLHKMNSILEEHEKRSNLYRNHHRLLGYLGDTAGFLPLATLPRNIFQKLDELQLAFPNFSPAIDFYRGEFALTECPERWTFSANPLLMAGPPGVGKTAFCHALSKIVSTYFEVISLSGMTAGFVLSGMSSGWAEGRPGRVVESLARGHRANPLILIDELDKPGGDKKYSTLDPLHQLLEKDSSAAFIDEALEISTDCSHIVWAGTANEPDLIPDSILSRFTVLEIKRPTPQEMENVLNSIYQKIRCNHRWGERFTEKLSQSVVNKVIESDLEPRVIQRELIAACGKAALRNRDKAIANGQHEINAGDFNPPVTVNKKVRVVMPVFGVASVQEEPEESMIHWSIHEVSYNDSSDKTHHLVGYIARQRLGRVSSAIQAFDRDKMLIKTRSGRIYHLKGQPGFNPDADYVWSHWKAINAVKGDVNVTDQYYLIH